MPVAVIDNDPFIKVKKMYEDDWRPAMIAALDETEHGSLFVKIEGPTVLGRDLNGIMRRKEGYGTTHEITKGQIEAEILSVTLVEGIVNELRAMKDEMDGKPPRQREMTMRRDRSTAVRRYTIYTEKSLIDHYRKSIIKVGPSNVISPVRAVDNNTPGIRRLT